MTIGIHMDGVASYKTAATLETDKKLTLVYGLNGTGKSTLSNYLYNPSNPHFASCKKTGLDDANIYVYNATFVRDNFYEKDNLRGIFTLSKANKEVEEKLAIARERLTKLNSEQEAAQKKIEVSQLRHSEIRTRGEESVWPIKTQFTGGDRVLAYCLTNLQIKAKLFDHLLGLPCPVERPVKTTDELKKNAEVLQDSSAVKLPLLQLATDFALGEADKNLMASSIVGNKNSAVAGLISKLQHADWVSEGVEYMDTLTQEGDETCPFCQQKTISSELAEAIRQYFDESFTSSVQALKKLQASYSFHWTGLQHVYESAQQHFLINESQKEKLSRDFGILESIIELNKNLLVKKVEHPSQIMELRETKEIIDAINEAIKDINTATGEHNKKLDDRTTALSEIKKDF